MEFEITPDDRLSTLEERLQAAGWRAGFSLLTGNVNDGTRYVCDLWN